MATAMVISLFSGCSNFTANDRHYDYGQKNVKAYADYSKNKHGPDGGLFLDPYFISLIQNLNGEKVLDVGCGAGPWSIYAAQNGGIVSGLDIQPGMIEAAIKATEVAGLSDKIRYLVGDASNLPYVRGSFDRAISICVGCNLPKEIFKKHIEEIQRTLKADGVAAIAAPTSLHVVFSDGSRKENEVHKHIQAVLAELPDNPSREEIADKLSKLTEVLSATFYVKAGRLTLLTSENEVREGDQIWRKLPKPIVPNFYYRAESYEKAIKEKGLEYTTYMPHFNSEAERSVYNASVPAHEKLGPAYVTNAPFVIFHVKKSA